MPGSQWYLGYLVDNMENIGIQVFNYVNSFMFSCSGNAQATFIENPRWKLSVFKPLDIDC